MQSQRSRRDAPTCAQPKSGSHRANSQPSGTEAGPAARVLALQSSAGNGAVSALLRDGQGAGHVVMRAPPSPAPAPGVSAPPEPAPTVPLKDFGKKRFHFIGSRFDLDYDPVGPSPAVGRATVKLKVNVIFKDFDRSMMRRPEFRGHRWTRAQLRDFKWPEAEQAAWVGKFGRAVSDGWKEKHTFVLREAGFADHTATCNVQVEHVDDPAKANNVITAQWVPRDAPRIRSFVSGSTSELDVRDVDVPDTFTVPATQLTRQIPGFEHDSDAINSTVESGITAFEAAFKRLSLPGKPFGVPKSAIITRVAGRTTVAGSRRYNRDLGTRRATAVADRLMDDLGLESTVARGLGARNATDDEKFRRVDVTALTGGDIEVTQNTAAHEAGHMFGLGDEYVEESTSPDVTPKFQADAPSHHGSVKDALGPEAADELLVQTGPSIMSSGSEVKAGHYVPFLTALNKVTSKTWTIE